jgi:hypothetical protein
MTQLHGHNQSGKRRLTGIYDYDIGTCKGNIEMAPLCHIEMTHAGFWGPGRSVMAVLSMSKQELNRLDVLLRAQSGRLRVADACALIGLRRRSCAGLAEVAAQNPRRSPRRRFTAPSTHRKPYAGLLFLFSRTG